MQSMPLSPKITQLEAGGGAEKNVAWAPPCLPVSEQGSSGPSASFRLRPTSPTVAPLG